MEIIVCRTCLLSKDPAEFRLIKGSRVLDCTECGRTKARESRRARYKTEEGRKAILESNGRYLKKPEIVERLSLLGKKRYSEDELFRDRMKEGARNWRTANPERKASRAHDYYQENKASIQEKTKSSQAANPWLRLRGHIRCRVSEALKAAGQSKNGESSFQHLPYTLIELKEHLETHPEWDPSWMSWSNYGKYDGTGRTWSLDHVVPQSMFPYSSMSDSNFLLCWDLVNLRPREDRLNSSEGNKPHLIGHFPTFSDLLSELVRSVSSPSSTEPVTSVFKRLSALTAKASCPMTFAGLNYLDGIFLNRFLTAKNAGGRTLLDAVSEPKSVLKTVAHLIRSEERVTISSILSNLKFVSRTPGHFFPGAAAGVWRAHAPPGLPVCDPFLGWGGRTLGAVCAGVSRIVGCDLQEESVSGCFSIVSDFSSLSSTDGSFHITDSLEFLQRTDDKFGMIFTSPPFMDTEDYGTQSDSMRQDWIESFVLPFVQACRSRLAPGGRLALHLKDVKGAPTFTAYHMAALGAGFKQIAKHKYGRSWTQSVYVYAL